MEVMDVIHKRRAIREFKPDPVPNGLLRELVEAASWAPSAMNVQAWKFVIVTNRALLDQMSERSKRWLLDNERALSGHESMRASLQDPRNQIFHNAPALLVIVTDSQGKWSAENCALAAENAMLAATAKGLGTCWIGLSEPWLNSREGLKTLELEEGDHVIAPIIVGYPLHAVDAVPRRQPKVVWIEPDSKLVEDGEKPALIGGRGFYGNLLHP
jgi:nitroreductase